MNTINSVAPSHQTREDYLYTPVIDTQDYPGVDDVGFIYGISPTGDAGVEVSQFCSEDGVQWNNMGETVSFNSENAAQGVTGILRGKLKNDARFQRFGFNVSGDNVDVWLFGLVIT